MQIQLGPSIFNKLYVCCLQQLRLTFSLWRVKHCLGNSLSCLQISMRPIWPTIHSNVTHWRLHLVTKAGQLGHCFPIIWRLHQDLLHIFQEVSTVVGIHTTLQMLLNSSYFSTYFLPFPSSPSKSIVSHQSIHKIYTISPPQGDPSAFPYT